MSQSGNNSSLFWGIIIIIFGVLFLLDNFYIISFGDFISTYWPLILVAIGVKILLDHRKQSTDGVEIDSAEPVSRFGERSKVEGISESNIFGDINLNLTSDNFKGGSISNVFGDIKLDISKAELSDGVTKVFISGVFGDVNVVTPKDIPIKTKTSCVAGDIGVRGYTKEGLFPKLDHTEELFEKSNKKLDFSVSIIFGSITIY